ncbi:MAG: hypothetical protein AAF804_05425 [Bacteroidota bacterium]
METISRKWFPNLAFSGYLVDSQQKKYYGLTLEELVDLYQQQEGHINSFTAVCSHPRGKVVRVSVHFFPAPTPHRVRYLIATDSRSVDLAIQQVFTGEEAPTAPGLPIKLPASEILAPAIRTRDAVFAPLRRPFQRPTLTLHDHFFFENAIEADEVVDMVNYLSHRHFNDAPFHLRMETIDGDFHLHLDRRELQYLFSRQGDKRLMLYLDASDRAEQWFTLRLSFHPLASGPNAEVSIISAQAEDILDDLKDILAHENQLVLLPERRISRQGWSAEHLTLSEFCQAAKSLSRDLLHRVPPVALVMMRSGEVLTGLSLYQLQDRLTEHLIGVERLVLFMGRISTGQIHSLWLDRREDNWAVTIGSLWGNQAFHLKLEHFWQEWGKEIASEAPRDLTPPSQVSSVAILLPISLEHEKKSRRLTSWLHQADFEPTLITPKVAHRDWEEVVRVILDSDALLMDISLKQPGVIFWTEMARQQGKRVVICWEQGSTLPEEFQDWPTFSYPKSRKLGKHELEELAGLLNKTNDPR